MAATAARLRCLRWFDSTGCVVFAIGVLAAHGQKAQLMDYNMHPDLGTTEIYFEPTKAQKNELEAAQKISEGKNVVYPIGTLIPAVYDLTQLAKWTEDESGNHIGKIKIISNEATGLDLFFDDFFLPIGARLVVSSSDFSERLGPFSFSDNKESGRFSTGTINGKELLLEVFLPKGTIAKTELMLKKLVIKRIQEKRIMGAETLGMLMIAKLMLNVKKVIIGQTRGIQL